MTTQAPSSEMPALADLQAPADPVWCLRPGLDLHTRSWEDGCVVYEHSSGMTVFVDDISHALLQHLASGPCDTSQLLNAMAARFEVNAADIPRQGINKRLRDLRIMELLEATGL